MSPWLQMSVPNAIFWPPLIHPLWPTSATSVKAERVELEITLTAILRILGANRRRAGRTLHLRVATALISPRLPDLAPTA